MVIATFTASQSEYDANALAATTANQTVSIPPRSRGVVGFVLETNDFSLTSATSSVNVTGGTPVLVTGNGFSTVGGEDDGDFLSCFFGTIGPIDARVTASKTATCYSPARAAAATDAARRSHATRAASAASPGETRDTDSEDTAALVGIGTDGVIVDAGGYRWLWLTGAAALFVGSALAALLRREIRASRLDSERVAR